MMNREELNSFVDRVNTMKFINIDDLYAKIDIVKKRYLEFNYDEKEVYKWYFFYQLCLLKFKSFKSKKYIKDLFWNYINDNCSFKEIEDIYNEFCEYRDVSYKFDKNNA